MLNARCFRTASVLLATSSLALAQWVQKTPPNVPSARSGAAMDFVLPNLGLVLFGGGAPLNNNQTWVYDGFDWTLLTPATSPSGRFGMSLVYDSQRNVAVMYGGLASNISIPPPTNETWEWDGTNWTQATPTANAGNRYQYGACFDSVRNRVVMFGGLTAQPISFPVNTTWEYDGTTWTQIATAGNPGGRERPAMCFDAALGKAVLFGGSDPSGLYDQTWLYDGTAATWTQVVVAGSKPSARNAAKMVYDSVRNLCVLTGGQDANGPLADTWTFDGATWTEQPTTTQTVRDHAFAFLPTVSQCVKFGGFAAAPNTLSNQTWELGSGIYGAGCAGSNGVPSMSASSAPTIGQSWTLDLGNLAPPLSFGFLVIGLTKVPGIDLSFLGMPGCAAFTSPDLLLSVMGAGGNATWTWPSVSGPLGGTFYCQFLGLDPPANTFGFTLSNAVYGTLDM